MSTSKKTVSGKAADPRLDIRTPVILGTVVVCLFFGLGVGGAAVIPIDKGVGMPGTVIVESRVKTVQHERGGSVGRLHVVEGQKVRAGDTLMTLDTRSLDEQIAALKAQSEASARQLDLARQEAATMQELLSRKLAAKSRVLGLKRQVAEIEKEAAGIQARIAVAQQELERAELKSPVAGRVLRVHVHGPGAVVQPGGNVIDIVPELDRLVIEARMSPNQIEEVSQGMPARVWLTALSWRDQKPLPARLAWVSPDSVEDKRTGATYFVARVELNDSTEKISQTVKLHPGMRSEVLLLTGKRTLLDQLVDPILRNVNRAFRS